MIRMLLLVSLLFVLSNNILAQSELDTSLYKIKLYDGQVLKGKIIKETTKEITLTSESLGSINILQSDIKSIEQFRNRGHYPKSIHDLYRSKYFLTESAFMPNKGQVFIENKMYFMMGVGLGLTNHVSFDVNTFIVPDDFDGIDFFTNYGIKFGYSFNKNIHTAVRYNYARKNDEGTLYRNYLIGYLTLGRPQKNITLGFSRFGYYGDYISNILIRGYEEKASPLITFAANIDINKRSNFKFEHAYLFNNGGVTNMGFGWNGTYWMLNYGVILPLLNDPEDEIFPIPYLSFIIQLGNIY